MLRLRFSTGDFAGNAVVVAYVMQSYRLIKEAPALQINAATKIIDRFIHSISVMRGGGEAG